MLSLVDEDSGVRLGPHTVINLQRTGAGRPLLLLHGVEGPEADAEFIALLADHYQVIVPTHPGFGLSPRNTWDMDVSEIATLYVDLLDSLSIGSDVTLVGLQFGGWIAAHMAVNQPNRFSDVFLVSPVGVKAGERSEREIMDVFAVSREELNQAYFADQSRNPFADLTLVDRETALHVARNEEALVSYGWEPYLHTPNLHHWLYRIAAKTTLIRGAKDRVVSDGYVQRFAGFIPGSSVVSLDECAHFSQIEVPAAVVSVITGGTK